LGRIEIDRDKCKGCALCTHFCPKGCLIMDSEINRKGYRPCMFKAGEECSGCAVCARVCPDIAIEVWR